MKLGKLNIDTGTIDNVNLNLKEPIFSANYSAHLFKPNPYSISSIITDDKQNIFIISPNDGIFLFNTTTRSLFQLNNNFRLYHNAIQDKNNRIWLISKFNIGVLNTVTGGVVVTDRSSIKLKHITSQGAFVGTTGNIWLPRYSGICKLDIDTGKVKHINNKIDTGGSLGFTTPDGSSWVVTWNGSLGKLNEEDGTFNLTDTTMDLIKGFSFVDSNGRTWVGSHKGIGHLDTTTGKITKTDNSNYESGTIVLDKNNNYWVSSKGNFGIFDITTGKINQYQTDLPLNDCNKLTRLVKDKSGDIWAFTSN
jgi:ligand-binding sensor domain-containing protein